MTPRKFQLNTPVFEGIFSVVLLVFFTLQPRSDMSNLGRRVN